MDISNHTLVPGTALVAVSLLDKPFRKKFGVDTFCGIIKQYRQHKHFYYVLYEDGDEEELDAEELLSLLNPRDLIGIRFHRFFPGYGLYEGTVESFEDAYYRIIYDDDDVETFTYRELMACLILHASSRKRKYTTAFQASNSPPPFQHKGIAETSFICGLPVQSVVLAHASVAPNRSFFYELFNAARTLNIQQRVGSVKNAMRPSTMFEQFGCTYELISTKLMESGLNFRGVREKRLEFIYIATSGPNLVPISLQRALEDVADFASLPSAGKVASRLELFHSSAMTGCPPHLYNMSDIELIDESISTVTMDYMADGCGFIGCEMLNNLVDDNCLAVQVRIFGPQLGVYKGMLCRKAGIESIQLPPSMRKIPPSVTNDDDWVSVIVIRACPSSTCVELGRYFANNSIRPSFQAKPLCSMVWRLLTTLGVPNNVMKAHTTCTVPSHCWLVGLADPTFAIPSGYVFMTGFNTFHDKYDIASIDEVFVTRSPCVKAEHGRMLPLLTSKPAGMEHDAWQWLLGLPFGGLIFSTMLADVPLAMTCADGDLDGDRYLVCWDKNVLRHVQPRELAAPPVKPSSNSISKERNKNWFCEAQQILIQHALLNSTLISRLYSRMEKIHRTSIFGMDDPDARLLADAYTHTLANRHEKPRLKLPARLRAGLGI